VKRQLFGTATFANNATLFAQILSLAEAAYQPVQSVAAFQASIVLQPMPCSITSRGAANGGNVLGLDGSQDLVCTSPPTSLSFPTPLPPPPPTFSKHNTS
jgi:hypothetical protein